MLQQKRLLISLIVILLSVLTGIMFVWNPSATPVRHSSVPLELKSRPIGGDFTVEILNADLSLSDLHGKTVILYFGYTLCPDICPITLSTIADALNQMTPRELEDVQALFVSFDPERDNTTRLEEYSQNFHKSLIGATAEPETLMEITGRYGVAYEFVEGDLPVRLVIKHSSSIYIIDKAGSLVKSLPYGTKANEILDSVRETIVNSN